jgi:AcrR family transcriptional regulator
VSPSVPPRADAVRSRERILAAAAKVLADHPTASMEAVVARAGLARATVYRHFPTRDDLVRAVTDRALTLVGDLLAQARPQDGDVLGAVDRLTTAAFGAGQSAMALVALVAEGQVSGTNGEHAARVDRIVTQLVERGQDDGTLRRDVPTAWLVDMWFAVLQSALVHAPPAGTDPVASVVSLFTGAAAVRG